MTSKATTIEQYFEEIPTDRKSAMQELHTVIEKNLPKGFNSCMQYGMIAYVVPHSIYPAGYHCDPKQPLPFMCIASQKNFIAIYHMGLYANPEILEWFKEAYSSQVSGKLDMGKSCLRFKKPEKIPVKLIGELCKKITVKQWISMYEKAFKK